MTHVITYFVSALVYLLLQSANLIAQNESKPLTLKEKTEVVDSVSNKLASTYIFPEVATSMGDKIKGNMEKGVYATLNDPFEFANRLTEDLQAVSKDKHIRVGFDPRGIAEQNQVVSAEDSIQFRNRYIANLKRTNFGFKEVKMLGGNVGYLDLRSFSDVNYAGETAVAAMNFLSNADAIIIDLRFNGGGSPAMIQLISSYLFQESVHLNNFYWRAANINTQTWTLPHVSGKKSPDTPVYILTSGSSFSAAEEFSYNLKNLKRATLVGETTGGGAHPGGTVVATDRFTVWIPYGRAINPITNTNWEGTGVTPHIAVPAKDALTVAHMDALEKLIAKHKDTEQAHFYKWPIVELQIENSPLKLKETTLKKYVGAYGPRIITFENGQLYYQRGTGIKYTLIPYEEDEFILDGLDYFRIKFVSKNSKVIALEGLYDDGRTDKNFKDNQ
ncbi:peptidase S41-like protein [Ulvibacter sp. MAR_2010_11]|uniref:S41 family peptidase n=1 Tax=Ulvibacter sp. MAR_2010_11 TaxID=1250229 RepID=UPI000C2B55EE|nr:S41 family peptidase [Ulvibacter sp. MAR_2010_11]PKA83395.1 peptidase S41-like protein [Ulvibacter sp. MAR_2010_11]